MNISLVVPIYNEESAIPIFYSKVRTLSYLKKFNVEIVFINDGSIDNSEEIVKSLMINDLNIQLHSFTRNFGKEAALFAGLEKAKGDAIIPIDVDLQDPIEVLPRLIEKWHEGYDVVLAKRSNRLSDSYLKRKTAEYFYKIHNSISSLKIEENVGDFRLISKNVRDEIVKITEKNLFMKGVFSWVGGSVGVIEYVREARCAGKSKFNGWRLWNFALEGITSFSTLPLRVWTYIGSIISLFSFVYGLWVIISKLIWGNDVAGFPTIIVSILFLSGVQLIGIGILGEYVGRVYIEVKNRPRYIIKNEKESQNGK